MKVLVIPDSFKGNLSSPEICAIVSGQISAHYPAAEIVCLPVADGGEGSVDAFLTAAGGERVTRNVKNPYFEDIEAFYGILADGETAAIEMAAAAGLPLVGERLCPARTTTYGVGQLIADAVGRGCKRIILGLGGSATNDFGTGAAAALGVRFLDADGQPFVPTGGTLSQIAGIDTSARLPGLDAVPLIAMCDIDNPLYGESGAAHVFAPQKGADQVMVEALDAGLRVVSDTVIRELGVDVSALPGAGAAGGMGGGMAAFFGARLQSGIETVLEAVNFDALLEDADLVITGEGKIDRQSLGGKVVIGVARRAKRKHVPVIAIVGDIGDDIAEAYDEGVGAIFSINRVAVPFAEAKQRCRSDLALTVDNLMRFFRQIRWK